MSSILQCPVCRNPLFPSVDGYQCVERHNFDVARQGYVNLVLSHNKHSRAPGDDPEMIQSRRRFLGLGYYDQVSDGINQAIATVLAGLEQEFDCSLLDAGCGEGFYLQRLKAALGYSLGAGCAITYHGVDVSKFAVRQATQRDRGMDWFVASINDLPFVDDSLDLLLSVFSPANIPEFARILKPNGSLVFVSPGPQHLNGLREIIYPVTREHAPPTIIEKARQLFAPASVTRVTYPLALQNQQEIMDLLAMTPYYWNIDEETKGRVATFDHLALDVDVEIRVFQKRMVVGD